MAAISPATPAIPVSRHEILASLKKLDVTSFFPNNTPIFRKLESASPIELPQLLRSYFQDLIADSDPHILQKLDLLAQIIPNEKLASHDALIEAQSMFREAQLYVGKDESLSDTIRERLSEILEGLISLVEILISSFGVSNFFKKAENDFVSDLKAQKLIMLMTLFSTITTVVLPLMNATTAALYLGGAFLTITAVSFIWPYIKPMNSG